MEGLLSDIPEAGRCRKHWVSGFGDFVFLIKLYDKNLFKQILKKVLTNLFKQAKI